MTAMYQNYFGLAEAPFSIAPAPHYLFLSQRHQEALAHLLYGLGGDGGFVLLTGEVGTGKTTVCRSLLDQMPESCDVAYIFNPRQSVEELLSSICTEFGIEYPSGNTSNKVFIDSLNEYLLDSHARGRHAVLIIDEAQNLSAEVLEQMRLLTNLETSERKLLQIILIGQPELSSMLARPELRQLAQRVVARYHLGPLTRPEVAAYIQHRLGVAGTQRPLFPAKVTARIFRLSGGIPRVINLLCDRALLGAYAQGKEKVDRTTVDKAAREIFGTQARRHFGMRPLLAAGLLMLLTGVLGGAWFLQQPQPKPEKVLAKAIARISPLTWPAEVPRAESENLAYSALFSSWGGRYRGENPCQQSAELGLSCLTGIGGLFDLRLLNLPAVLGLHDNHGQEFDATLTSLGTDTATLIIGGKPRVVPLNELSSQWSGQYTLLWRRPGVIQDKLMLEDRGPGVVWLREQLARRSGIKADSPPNPVFDDALEQQVKTFQTEHNLKPDGRAGARTLILLLSTLDPTAPSLTKPGK